MKVYGLTGGIGMGKTTAARLLLERGIGVVDTDELARRIVEPGQPALVEVAKVFGRELLADNGRLRRDELARRVFEHAGARKQLEAILHPRIRELWLAQIAAWRDEDRSVAVVVIPLLFETDATSHFDQTICLACSVETQHARLLARGWSAEQIAQRLAAQWPIEKKMALANHVIWTEGSVEALAEQLRRVIG